MRGLARVRPARPAPAAPLHIYYVTLISLYWPDLFLDSQPCPPVWAGLMPIQPSLGACRGWSSRVTSSLPCVHVSRKASQWLLAFFWGKFHSDQFGIFLKTFHKLYINIVLYECKYCNEYKVLIFLLLTGVSNSKIVKSILIHIVCTNFVF